VAREPRAEHVGERAVQHRALEPDVDHAAALAERRADRGERVGHADPQRGGDEQEDLDHTILRARRSSTCCVAIAKRITRPCSASTSSFGTLWFTTSPP